MIFLRALNLPIKVEKMMAPIFRMKDQLQKEKHSIFKLLKERVVLIENSNHGIENLHGNIQAIALESLPSNGGSGSHIRFE